MAVFYLLGRLDQGKRAPKELHLSRYDLVSPLLECYGENDDSDERLDDIRDAVEAYVTKRGEGGDLRSAAFYFRDLDVASSTGFDEDEKFAPASLLKLPVLFAYLKQAEEDPSLFLRKLTYKGELDPGYAQHFQSAPMIEPGGTYTVEELLGRMIVNSDNNAMELLVGRGDRRTQARVFRDFGVPPVRFKNYELTVRQYATFFRILYNASYLGADSSDRAMRLLTRTTFTRGLVAGVPPDVLVAHKYGEHRAVGEPDAQFHDCGIVYHPARPYLICVMTRGSDFDRLATVIAGVSEIAYREFDALIAEEGRSSPGEPAGDGGR